MHAARPAADPPARLEWPFIGRDDELARIAAARREDTPGVVLLAGAGVGKSRLARCAVRAAEQDGAHVAWIQATRSAAAVPLGACAGIVPPEAPAQNALGLMRASAAWLAAEAAGRPVVLGVDDAQLLDLPSAALVLHLALTGAAFVVATVRDGEPRPDAVDALWKDAGLRLHTLRPLDEADTAQVVEAALGGPAEEHVRRWAFRTSGGNVLYIRELVTGALADGALVDRGGYWCLTREPAPSASLAELVDVRLAGIADAERRSLELLALAEPLPLAELMELAGAEPLAGVEARGLVVAGGASPDSLVRLAHPLYGEVVRASMPAPRARTARLRVAAVVQARPRRGPDDQLRIARWLLDAGEPVPPDVAVDAAETANLAGDAGLGAQLAADALTGRHHARAALALAHAHAIRKRFADAEAVLAAAEDRFDDQELALRALELRVALLQWSLDRPEEALACVARAAERWTDAAWRARVDSVRLYPLMWTDHAAAIAGTEALLADAATPDDVRPRLRLVRAGALFFAGRGREACELARTVRPPVPLRGTHERIAFDVCAMIELETGEDLAGAEAWLAEAMRAAVAAHDAAAAGLAAWSLAELCRVTGRLREGERWIAEAAAQYARRDPFRYASLTQGLAAGIAFELGDVDTALAAGARAAATAGDAVVEMPELPNRVRAEAWLALAEGDPPRAQGLLLEAAERSAAMPLYALRLRYEAMRAGARARAVLPGVDEIAPRCDARLHRAFAAHVRARAARDGAALLEAATALEDAGALRWASEAAAHAAEAFAADGRADSARRAARRCRELHARGQGGTPPVIPGLDAKAVELTPREAQFVDLAARGMSNAEIAERLVLSVRTVESHLYRAMQKLGVSDRRQLKPQP